MNDTRIQTNESRMDINNHMTDYDEQHILERRQINALPGKSLNESYLGMMQLAENGNLMACFYLSTMHINGNGEGILGLEKWKPAKALKHLATASGNNSSFALISLAPYIRKNYELLITKLFLQKTS